MILKHEKQILIFLHHFQAHFRSFSLQKVADSKDLPSKWSMWPWILVTHSSTVRRSEHRDHAGCCIGWTSRRIVFPVAASGSVQSPRLSTIFLFSRPVPIRFLRVLVYVYFHRESYIRCWSRGTYGLVDSRAFPFLCHFCSVAKGFPSRANPNITCEL